jgi:hypothetical protein
MFEQQASGQLNPTYAIRTLIEGPILQVPTANWAI